MLSFDQLATLALNGSQNLFLDNLMITVTDTFSWSLVIATLLYLLFKNNDWKEALFILITIGLMIFVADRICSGWVKPTVARWRPARDPEIMYLVDTVVNYRGGRYGFFSGHACNTACVAMFLAWLFRHKPLTVILFFWSVTTTYTRIYLGVHYLGDILVGWAVGCIIGFLFYLFYNHLRGKIGTTKLISEQFTSSGYLLTDINLFITVIALNYILVTTYSLTRGVM